VGGAEYLFDVGEPVRPGRPATRPPRSSPSEVIASQPPEEVLAQALLLLEYDQFQALAEHLPAVVRRLAPDPIADLLQGWCLMGLGRRGEAEQFLLRADLHRRSSRWRLDRLLVAARLAAAKKEAPAPGATPAHAAGAAPRASGGRAKGKAAPSRGSVPAKPEPNRPREPAPILPRATVTPRYRVAPRESPPLGPAAGSPAEALGDHRLRGEAVALEHLRRYETLLCLGHVQGVDHYEYQLRTVRRVLRDFRGRALLADEVGLGKTIEACLCVEEYLRRGLARRVLFLVPPGLVEQWRDELLGKFGRAAQVVDGASLRRDSAAWRQGSLLLASTGLARGEAHHEAIAEAGFDMVVVDEAHRLKNRATKLWRLVDRVKSRFLLLLSATPVENDLLEIYNVLSLLRPGLFSTQAEFRRRFMTPGKRTPRDPAALRALLRQVMIRNTRALAEARLPARFATTLRAEPEGEERALLADLDAAVRRALAEGRVHRHEAGEVLRAVGAHAPSASAPLARHLDASLATRAAGLGSCAKEHALRDLLARRPDDKVIVFARQREVVERLLEIVRAAGRRPVRFHGSLSPTDKARAVASFRDDADTLVATESGGEGFNLHFARTIVNFDLPWNPMRIEQRIGRVHRIGQERDVFVFNLVTAGTIEEEILRVLDEKIAMFELVVGEVEAILGRLGDDEREFSDLVLDIYAESGDPTALRERFDRLAERMLAARGEHQRVRALEDETFGRDLEA